MTSLAPAGPPGGNDPRRQHLLRALDTFEAVKSSRQVALEVDCAALIAPLALVGRQLRLYWPEDDAWYAGTVASYDPSTGKHTIDYTDGDQEAVHIAAQRVKVALIVGADLPVADPDELDVHCAVLKKYASKIKSTDDEQKELKMKLQARVPKLRAVAAATRARLAQAALAVAEAEAAQAAAEAEALKAAEAGETAAEAPAAEAAAAEATAAPMEADPTAEEPPDAPEAPPEVHPPSKKQKKRGKSGKTSKKDRASADEATRAAAEAWASTLRPGDVVWSDSFKVFPPWPAMVITREQCLEGKVAKEGSQTARCVPLKFFGSYERFFAHPSKLKPLREGILEGLYRPTVILRATNAAHFARSVGELADYMLHGDVSEWMFFNNDGEDDSEEEEEADRGGKSSGGGKRGGGGGGEGLRWTSITREPNMPMVVGNLKVLSLGKVQWLHPGFHDERTIWPVGYRAERVVRTPAGGPKPVRHLCEVLEAPDGSGPIFKVTPWGGSGPVEGRTLNRAWAALFEVGTKKGGSTQLVKGATGGARQFGLTATSVLGAILALPGAERCERFAGWPEDAPPRAVPPLTPEELQQRLAYEAAAARLPDGVVGAAAVPTDPGVCAVCMEEEEEDDDLVLQCDRCGLFAHTSCYGVAAAPEGRLWLCDPCQAGAPSPPPACALCPVLGGALKRTDCGRWAHPTCALWIPDGPFLDPGAVHCGGTKGLVRGLDAVPQERRALKCSVCAQPHGACIQCSNPGCYTAFHVMCARQAPAYHMRVELASDDEEEEDDEAVVAAGDAGGSGSGRATPDGAANGGAGEGRGSGSPSGDENVANGAAAEADAAPAAPGVEAAPRTEPNGSCAAEPAAAPDAPGPSADSALQQTTVNAEKKPEQPRKKRRRPKRRPPAADHAVILNGARLLAFCARHNPLKTTARAADPMEVDRPPIGGAGGPAAVEAAAAAAAARGWPVPGFPSPYPCARAIPLDAALRRGPRAPEALEAALAKRRYVEATPLLVGGPTPIDPGVTGVAGMLAPEERGRCTWHRQPAAVVAAAEGKADAAAAPEPAVKVEPETTCQGTALFVEGTLPVRAAAAAAVRAVKPEPAADAAAAAAVAAVMEGVVGAVKEPLEVGDNQSRPSNSREGSGGSGGGAGGAETPGPQQVSTARGPDPEDGVRCPENTNAANGNAFGGGLDGEDGDAVVPTLAPVPRAAAAAEALRSSSERYYEMRATEGARVVPGKSAIHGWGAFARVPHKMHEMVIEYVGDLVRPSVAEARERSAYDSLVGAGTYVFRLNTESCVDATRSGNLAHLLNHSCTPNCYSRTVPVWDPAAKRSMDHVVIFAARDIEAWEELTYDYRFSGEERLVCNCGTEGCRGMVNKKESGGALGAVYNGGLLPVGTEVPVREVRGRLVAVAAERQGGGGGNGKKRHRE